jgi:hypothetical protein
VEGTGVCIFKEYEYIIKDINVNLPEENGENRLQQLAFHYKTHRMVTEESIQNMAKKLE